MDWDPNYEPDLPRRERHQEMLSALEGSINCYQTTLRNNLEPSLSTRSPSSFVPVHADHRRYLPAGSGAWNGVEARYIAPKFPESEHRLSQNEELEELVDEYYAWMEDDKQEVRKVLAEDAVSEFPERADEAPNPKTRKRLKGRKTGGKQSIFERLHKTGLRGSLTSSSQELTEQDAAVLASLQLNKETQTKEAKEAKSNTDKQKPKSIQVAATSVGTQNGHIPADPDSSRRRAMGPMACTDADKHASGRCCCVKARRQWERQTEAGGRPN
mmetsp:Transcript_21238/g.46593  ORF Transcript_21238/g.46593 Transcript_21238/m.46593 type:complete len:271 (+) Transcript_21238:1469-2281(+)